MNKRGFTLIELMIVIAIIAIIAAIAIPGLLRARIGANEGSAIGTLRTISTSQAQFQSAAQVDQDNDGCGEFALLGELTGHTQMRTKTTVADPAYLTKALSPTDTTADAGSKSGFFYKIYLPVSAVAGNPLTDVGAAAVAGGVAPVASVPADANRQEVKWRGYAWPVSAKTTGNRAFAVDQGAEAFACGNATGTTPIYTSANTMPTYDAATTADDTTFLVSIVAGAAGPAAQSWAPAQ